MSIDCPNRTLFQLLIDIIITGEALSVEKGFSNEIRRDDGVTLYTMETRKLDADKAKLAKAQKIAATSSHVV